jgi:NAD(P)-dependent dehydrogenase (short-subunit alcohol dehydrogenase family)
MTSTKKIAVVTGANRGIGFEVCRQLGKQDIHVILTSRDEEKGKTAAEELQKEGLEVTYHPLEVTDEKSVDSLKSFLVSNFCKLDILVNNAGILIDPIVGDSILKANLDILRKTAETNLYAPMMLCQALIPLMQQQNYGRVVNVSSGIGQISGMDDMKFIVPGYRLSKTALNVVTRMLASELKDTNILVNSVCPGWVNTGLGGPNAPRTPSEGADSIVWLATLADDGPRGGFFRDRKPMEW